MDWRTLVDNLKEACDLAHDRYVRAVEAFGYDHPKTQRAFDEYTLAFQAFDAASADYQPRRGGKRE